MPVIAAGIRRDPPMHRISENKREEECFGRTNICPYAQRASSKLDKSRFSSRTPSTCQSPPLRIYCSPKDIIDRLRNHHCSGNVRLAV